MLLTAPEQTTVELLTGELGVHCACASPAIANGASVSTSPSIGSQCRPSGRCARLFETSRFIIFPSPVRASAVIASRDDSCSDLTLAVQKFSSVIRTGETGA